MITFLEFISIDSFYNAILFIIVYSINLSKCDKINFYQSLILSTQIRYLYILTIYLLNILINELFIINLDMSILVNPLITYLVYNKTRFRYFYSRVSEICVRRLKQVLCYLIYNILNFLIKIILEKDSKITLLEVEELCNKLQYEILLDFLRSFIISCLYEYISVSYKQLAYLFNYNNNFKSKHEKKQYILEIINDKNWQKFIDNKTISIFFDIYKTSNNTQISDYIEYQLNRFKFWFVSFCSVWSLISYSRLTSIIPIIYFYYQKDIYYNNKTIFILLSIICFSNYFNYILVLILFSIKVDYYYKFYNYLLNLNINTNLLISNFCLFNFVYLLNIKHRLEINLFYLLVFYVFKYDMLLEYIFYILFTNCIDYSYLYIFKLYIVVILLKYKNIMIKK
jgi:hypothetical protein